MPAITQNDFLNPLLSLHPAIAALIVWVTGYGSLLLLAAKTRSLKSFLKQPGFMVGDSLMMPAAALFITLFYQQVNQPLTLLVSINWTYVTASVALIVTAFSTYRTLYIWKTAPKDIFLAPHVIYYFFMAYALINFFGKGFLQLLATPTVPLLLAYLGATVAAFIHFVVPMIYGKKMFPLNYMHL